jgi:hypothetical protein
MSDEENFEHIKEEKLGLGMSFMHGYKDIDEMFAHMAAAEKTAMERVLPEQRAMIDSSQEQWFLNLSVNPEELAIFGEAWSLRRARKEELESYHVQSVDELGEEDRHAFHSSCKMMADSRRRGYIFGRAYSEIEPRGELGSTHVADMWPLTEAAFNEAREQDWRPDLSSNQKSAHLRTCLLQYYIKYKIR